MNYCVKSDELTSLHRLQVELAKLLAVLADSQGGSPFALPGENVAATLHGSAVGMARHVANRLGRFSGRGAQGQYTPVPVDEIEAMHRTQRELIELLACLAGPVPGCPPDTLRVSALDLARIVQERLEHAPSAV